MNLIRIVIDASRGIGDAHYNQRLREGNRDANLGMNHFFSCITQYSLLENTFSKVNEIVKNLSFTKISPISPPLTASIAVLIPLSLTFAKKTITFTNHPTIHTTIATLDNQILPDIILITNLVAAVAYMVFSSQVYGSVNLLFLLLYVMHEKGWMDKDFIQKNWFIKWILETSTITIAFDALLINRSLNPYYLWILADKTYQAVHYITKPVDIKIASITLREYQSKYSELTDIPYRLQEYHLLKQPVSNHPLENLTPQLDRYASSLKEYLEQDFSLHNKTLIHKFRNEERWILDYNNNPIDYLTHGINSFLQIIEISNNLEFKNKSLSIIRYVLNLTNDERINRVADLAIIGHYCPERLYSDITLLYDTYIDTFESRDLSTKVVNLLHHERMQILDQFLAGINEAKSFLSSMVTSILNTNDSLLIRQRLTDLYSQLLASLVPLMDDIHFVNSMKLILCPYLYVHHKSIDTLTEVNTKNLSWSLLNWFYQKVGFIELVESMFAKQYSPGIVLRRISNIIEKEPTISTIEIAQWFIEQYMCDYKTANRSTAEEWFRNQVYTLDDNDIPTIKPYYILFFLINQGVLQIENNPSFDKIPRRILEVTTILFSPDPLLKEEMTFER